MSFAGCAQWLYDAKTVEGGQTWSIRATEYSVGAVGPGGEVHAVEVGQRAEDLLLRVRLGREEAHDLLVGVACP